MLPKDIKVDIGNRIRDFRVQNKYKQELFAEGIDISVNFLSEIENGKKGFSAETLYKLCDNYHVSADYILFGENNPENPSKKIIDYAQDMNLNELKTVTEYMQALLKVKTLKR